MTLGLPCRDDNPGSDTWAVKSNWVSVSALSLLSDVPFGEVNGTPAMPSLIPYRQAAKHAGFDEWTALRVSLVTGTKQSRTQWQGGKRGGCPERCDPSGSTSPGRAGGWLGSELVEQHS